MGEIFLRILNMSISASWLILVVLVFRIILKKAPKWISVLLWGMVALRLICPFTIESPVSLIPVPVSNGELVAEWMDDYLGEVSIIHDRSINYEAAVAAGREPVFNGEGYYVVTQYDQLGEPSTVENTVLPVLTIIWAVGVALLFMYTIISYLRLRQKVNTAIPLRKGIYQSENVSSPFVLGIIVPKIYLPFTMNESDLDYVIAHEQAHIRRKDHWWKPLGFLLLTIHWFNPFMWLAYELLCRDVELACDEKVIIQLNHEQRADYTQALLSCSVNRSIIAACPLAFGEVGVKERIKAVMNYKKPAFWIIVVSAVVCVVLAVCFLTNPKEDIGSDNNEENVSGENLSQTNVSENAELSENNPLSEEVSGSEGGESATQLLTGPPIMTLQDCRSSTWEMYPVQSGTYSWNYAKDSKETVSVEASGLYPTLEVKGKTWLKIPDYNGAETVQYMVGFSVRPDRLQITSYDLLDLADEDATMLSNEVTEICLIELKLRRIYEITAEWDEEHLEERGFYGSASYAFAVDWEYRTPGEEQELVTIQAHIKDTMTDTTDRICISSDTDGYPGAFEVIVPENVYDKEQLYGGQDILITMQNTGEANGTLPVYEALYVVPFVEENPTAPEGNTMTGMQLPAVGTVSE